ncbi:hypothetical protein [Gordonia westfalica]|nr:hypothetical protein [Gordonia westfalica]
MDFVPGTDWPILYVTNSTSHPETVGEYVPNDPSKLVRQDWTDA